MKKILIFILFLFFINKINANAIEEINIVCKDNEFCLNESKKPIFNEKNIYPGFSINKKIKIFNKTENICDLNLKLNKKSKNSKLAEKILIEINKKNYSLNKILNSKKINLGKIESNSFKAFNFSYVLDKKTGNEFKNQKIDFDVDFNFNCENKGQITKNDEPKILGGNKYKFIFLYFMYYCFNNGNYCLDKKSKRQIIIYRFLIFCLESIIDFLKRIASQKRNKIG